jgi:fermentation-respiration switch protein FrsA (DUF1100 family)
LPEIRKRLRGILFMPITWPYILSLIVICIVLSVVFYHKIENFYVFFPQTNLEITPDDLNLNYRDVYFNSPDREKLHGWFFPTAADHPVIMISHGNACNISHMLDYANILTGMNLQVFLFDYRGYGRSTGTPSEKGIYMDAQAAYDYLVNEERIAADNIILFGQSLGAAAAIDVAIKNYIRSIIIEGAFTSTRDMAKTMFPLSIVSFLLPSNYNNLEKMVLITAPKLIVHGEHDEIVPFFMGKTLFEASMDPKYFYAIKGAGHNDTFIVGGKRYFEDIAYFANHSRLP